jgi:chaperonin GroEL (HSP60 family)
MLLVKRLFDMRCTGHCWQGSTNLESIQILKKLGGSLKDSFLDEGYVVSQTIFSETFAPFYPNCITQAYVETLLYQFQKGNRYHDTAIQLTF